MKVIYSVAYLIVCAGIMFIGLRMTKQAITLVRKRKTDLLKTSLLSTCTLILFFIQLWLLSQRPFPYLILLVLIVASFLAIPINEFIGSISGFTIKEKRNKINTLYAVTAFQEGLNHPYRNLIFQLTGYILICGWIGALVIFWCHPLGSPTVFLWSIILLFIVPQIINIVSSFNTIVPIITSEYVDDDLRNANLSQNFSSIIYSTIFFIFPFYILKQELENSLSWLPPYWVLISIPLMLFFVLGIIPFFMGLNKHHNQKKYFLEWQKDWLSQFKKTLYISVEQETETIQQEELIELNTEKLDRLNEDKINGFFNELQNIQIDPSQEIFLLLRDNEKNIRKWKLNLLFITNLEEIEKNISFLKNNKVLLKEYITDTLNTLTTDIENIDKEKNRLGGILAAALTALIGLIFKTYQEDILKILADFYHK